MSELLRYALRYVSLNQPIIPLHSIAKNGFCTCNNVNCNSPGKHPRTLHGKDDATTDISIIFQWWSDWPEANIGAVCGHLFDVIDVDPRNGGLESINGDQDALNGLLCQHTGSGGFHYLVKPGFDLHKRDGVDMLKSGKYIVVEPSLTKSHYYFDDWDVLNDPFPDLHPPPSSFLTKETKVSKETTETKLSKDDIDRLRSALNCFDTSDYDRWIRYGQALKSLGAVGRSLFFDWSMQFDNYDAMECNKKWESFIPTSISYKSIFYDALQSGWNFDTKLQNNYVTESKMEFISGDDLADNAKPPTYLIDDILESDSHGIMAGQSGAYKSFMALKMAHCICTGRDFFGKRVFEKGKVIYVCGEGEGNLSRRIKALKLEFGDFNGNLIVKKGRIRIDNADDIRELNTYVQEIRPSVIMFDTFSSMNSNTNENDNSEVGSALSMIHSAIANGHTSSMIVHHYGKDNDRGMRGASAFKNNTDFVMVMTRAEGERRVILSCDKTKDGEAFDDILCEAKVIELGLVRQNGNESSSLVLVDCNGEGIFRKSGRPNQNYAKFWQVYDKCLEEFPMEIMGQIGIDKKLFLQRCKNVLGLSDDAARMALKRFINPKISDNIFIEINGILCKVKTEQK